MIRIALTGDIFLSRQHWTFKRGILDQINSGSDILSKNLIEFISRADYFIGNLETPVLDIIPEDPIEFCFASSREILEKFLINIPHPILSIANNHILDHGVEGYQQTLKILNDLGVTVIGSKTLLSHDPFVYIEDPSGTTIALSAFCNFETGLIENELIWPFDRDFISMSIENAKKRSQVAVVYLHWGREFLSVPSSEQVKAMMEFNESGADIIVGHHPHVRHAVYNTGKSVFASSLGNFIFDQYESRATRMGNLLLVDYDNQKLGTEIGDIYIPRKLPVKIVGIRRILETHEPNIRMVPDSIHRFFASVMTQIHRILLRIDLILHLFPDFKEKLRCMLHWSLNGDRSRLT